MRVRCAPRQNLKPSYAYFYTRHDRHDCTYYRQNVKPNFLLYRRKQEVAPPRACLCHHKVGQLRKSRENATRRQIGETKLRRKADALAYALAGLRSADLWPSVATRGPPQGPQASAPQPAATLHMPPPPRELGAAPPQKRKAEAVADSRQKLSRMQ